MLITPELRKQLRTWVMEAVAAGARLLKAVAIVGLNVRSFQRWQARHDEAAADPTVTVDPDQDRRSLRVQNPVNRLTEAERAEILRTVNLPEYADLPVTQIVPKLADEGRYVGSEATLYRVLRAAKQNRRRRLESPPRPRPLPKHLTASGPGQLACWDITYLPSGVRGQYWYAYVVLDVYSRKAVAWQVYAVEDQHYASELLRDYVAREGIQSNGLTLHADNGAVMKGASLYATLQDLKIAPSHSRASVSNDNPYIESLFGTIKYRPEDPLTPFATLAAARTFMDRLLTWYNDRHRHSGIQYVTPSERHSGADRAILARRRALYAAQKQQNPRRWSGPTRGWERAEVVELNAGKPKSQEAKIRAAG